MAKSCPVQDEYNLLHATKVEIVKDRVGQLNRPSALLEFENRLSFRVSISGRDGIPLLIEPVSGVTGQLIMYKSYRNMTYIDPYDHYVKRNLNNSEHSSWVEGINNFRDSHIGTHSTPTVSYTIDEEELKRLGKVYYKELDIVISIDASDDIVHPYHGDADVDKLLCDESRLTDIESRNINIFMVDNSKTMTPRYINVLGVVYEVPINYNNKKLQNGIYICTNDNSQVQHFTYEEAEKKLNMYMTYNEAEVYGDDKVSRDLKLAELQHSVKVTDVDITKMAQEYKTTETELKRIAIERNNELELQKARAAELEHELKMQSVKSKYHYEERSYARKDGSEMLKMLPLLITSAVAIFALITKGNN